MAISQLKKRNLVLIVEDNTAYVFALKTILKKNGFTTVEAETGNLGLEFARKENPDLILLDIMLPDINGYDICKQLKADEATKDIPTIFITARNEVEDIIKGLECGAVDYVTKPFNSTELIARVKTHIELKYALEEIKVLKGIIPICSSCKKIRDDKGFWEQVEVYIAENTDAAFSQSICPSCSPQLQTSPDA
ncbi:MAG: response regulator [bacterium]|nr:response regulator [bacterium]